MATPLRLPAVRFSAVLAAVAAALLIAAPAASARVAPPKLDPTFGSAGRVEPTYPPSFAGAFFRSASVGADGSFLATRQDTYNGAGFVSEVRYLANGQPDPSFKSVEKEEVPEAVDAKGRTLRVQTAIAEEAFERLNPDGSVDTSLGAGQFEEPRSKAVEFRIEAILPLASGKIVVAGTVAAPGRGSEAGTEVAVAMYDESGLLDPTFGNGGVVDLAKDDGAAGEELIALTAGPGEDALVSLNDESSKETAAAIVHSGSRVAAVGPDGHLDPGFAAGGIYATADAIGAVAGLPGGGLLIAGDRWHPGPTKYVSTADLLLTRLTAAGAPDPTFGESGGATTIDLDEVDIAHSLLVRPDGSIVLGGATMTSPLDCPEYGSSFCTESPVLVGFTPNGARDANFGDGGVAALRSLAFGFAPSGGIGVLFLRNLSGGGVLAGGGTWAGGFLAELDAGGRPDPGFGDEGIVRATHPRRAHSTLTTMVTDPAGGILALGETDASGQSGVPTGAVFRFGPNGAVDRDFGEGLGYVRVPGRIRGFAVDRQGRGLVLAGKSSPDTVTRITPDGRVDRSFGTDGVAPLPESSSITLGGRKVGIGMIPTVIAPLPDGGVLVGAWAISSGRSWIGLIRLTPAGRLDPSFGRGGLVLIGLGHGGETKARALHVLPGGGILLGGSVRAGHGGHLRQTAAVIRLHPDGSLDRAFGNRGLSTVPLPGKGLVTALAVGPRGEIITGGRHIFKKRYGPLMARFSAAGRLDRGFVDRAARSLRVPADDASSPRQILLTAGRIIVPGHRPPWVFSYSPDGKFEGRLVLGKERKPATEVVGTALRNGRLLVATKMGSDPAFVLRRYLLPR
jgi:uncharacterized delta-60 repeat protein